MTFDNLSLIEPILKALKNEGYINPTPIQTQAIPLILEGKDLLGCAQTGTGKTAAFSIPIIQNLCKKDLSKGRRQIKALILTPTRELAIQIGESFESYGRFTNLKHTVIFGGVSAKSQIDQLHQGIDILVATPGRLIDLIGQRYVNLNYLDFFVLDEADRMLDMGFIHDIKRILPLLPKNRQSLFFSATMPEQIANLAKTILNKPAKVEVTPVSSTVEVIDQSVYFVGKNDKKDLLINILEDQSIKSILVFARTKHGSDKIAKFLNAVGIQTEAIHGNKSQNARQRALSNFKDRTTRVLVATDIAARGIDLDQLSHVLNFELPNIPETYVHRIGRTGRAGRDGVAISFCDEEEIVFLRDINKLIGKTIPVIKDHAYELKVNETSTGKSSVAKPKQNDRLQRSSSNSRSSDRRATSSSERKTNGSSDKRFSNSSDGRTVNNKRPNSFSKSSRRSD